MRAPLLAIALILSQGCAPASLGSATSALASSSGSMRSAADLCNSDLSCGGGGTGSVTIPVLIIIAALTVPATLHYWVFRSDQKTTSTPKPSE